MTLEELREIATDVQILGRGINVFQHDNGSLYIQLWYHEKCSETGEEKLQATRKWFISRHATKSEIVQTFLKAAITSAEHQVRENFLYRGRKVFGPHFNVDSLWDLCGNPEDKRK